jgi:tetratricopeptide (TPR) repeat protein
VTLLIDEVGIIRVQGGGPSPELLRQIETVLKEPVTRARGKPQQLPNTRSKAELEATLERAPADWRARLALAAIYDAEGRLANAISQLEAAEKLQPRESSIQFTWGTILLNRDQKEQALVRLKRARDLDPGNWRIHKQIWAIEHPEKFYTKDSPDFAWQKEELAREKEKSSKTSDKSR